MIQNRKREHVEIVLGGKVQGAYHYWDDVHLVHNALPEISLAQVSTEVHLLGARLSAPLIISSMTGGFEGARVINENLARAAQEVGVAFGVGSQRAALVDPTLQESYVVVKRFRPPLVFANIGAPQLLNQGGKPPLKEDGIEAIMDMVGAHALAVHLNFAQEVVQGGGDVNAARCLEAIERLCGRFPVVVKETGAGLSRDVAVALKDCGARAIDVGGAGGTSFVAVESVRAEKEGDEGRAEVARTFRDWGIPTPVAVVEARVGLPLVATGGIRSGLDVARAISLGADVAGIASPLLGPATVAGQAVIGRLNTFIEELKAAMFLTGALKTPALKSKAIVITGATAEWLVGRGHDLKELGRWR